MTEMAFKTEIFKACYAGGAPIIKSQRRLRSGTIVRSRAVFDYSCNRDQLFKQ